MPKMRVVQVGRKGDPFELVQRELPQPGPGDVRVKVQACGVCHSDSIAKEGLFPSVPYPIVPGHEIAGVIDAVGVGMDPIEVSALDLIGASRTIVGHVVGASIDSEDTMAFSSLTGVRPTIETMPLEPASDAYDRMMSGEARFRMVLTTGL